MKKVICFLISSLIVTSIFTSLCLSPSTKAKTAKRVSLKKSSVTLTIIKKKDANAYGCYDIKLKKAKGVKLKKITYKSLNKKVAKVNKKGRVTAKKQGNAKITVKVSYTYKNKEYKKSLTFKVKVNTLTEYKAFLKKLSKFSNKLYAMSSKSKSGNYVMSPASVYMALSMLYSVGDDAVKDDIEKLADMREADFKRTGKLAKNLEKDLKKYGVESKLYLTNSLWYDSRQNFNRNKLSELERELYCFAKRVPFSSDNSYANEKIRDFIKEKTNGLIDKDFNFDEETLFTLINTLYFKDAWDFSDLDTKTKKFQTSDGKKNREFLIANYEEGRAQETETARYFYAVTFSGYKLKLILPKDGYTLKQAMSSKNLNTINNRKDFKFKGKGNTMHYTRCVFPSFKIESDTPVKDILVGSGNLKNAFKPFVSPLAEQDILVTDIAHSTVLDVNKKGIEGAAVTAVMAAAASAPINTKVYHDFVLNKNFGFILTDPDDVILFEGQVVDP